jgi:hypothetical protein
MGKNQDPASGMNILDHISERLDTIFFIWRFFSSNLCGKKYCIGHQANKQKLITETGLNLFISLFIVNLTVFLFRRPPAVTLHSEDG